MSDGHPTLRTALEREHHEIDAGIEGYLADPTSTEALTAAFAALRRHIYLEEEHLFPPLRAAGLMAPVLVMLKEHGELWTALDDLDRQLAADAGAAELREPLEALLQLLDRHNAKEEPIVYAAADQGLDAETVVHLDELVATSTLPAGWVCQRPRTVTPPPPPARTR